MVMKKVLLIGASGTLGRAVQALLAPRYEVIAASRHDATHPVDLRDEASVLALFERVGRLDAIVSTTGNVHFGPLAQMTAAQFDSGLQDKLLGQVRLALLGQRHLNDGGSITLTTGILAEQPIAQGVNATAVNAAVEGFVRAAACELPRGLRINAVSPTVLAEAWDAYADFFPGFEPVPAARAALAFQRSIEGVQTGQIYKVW
ncbi:NAD(P)-dependent dehydrogenase (short-subunit alcohol dehydrogenase family) [Pseudoxanthomonas sp. SORGH_AS 997]|uniref:NAD(P)-dependent dehydrogenase (Short-subunit alcohol dehydrogenase family) n=2 Tax=Pseudoxanthomonas winnipegensis TaxID=2480810 RepID=A0AAW8G9D9_9GAMM|nr:NAD(P)-dependent dehydrogenase (short-subunit alcohol dehydrogenase family) [Pseudoxanthomonas winnipegensis]MDQ1132141.1 NAD(P)-dependent dehydrogenase (short-subunit alcohol dehydrogenase family) [Pseudoxanthomonas winnipegensis]MDR6137848.1 NAD(P)-dependent dehydrogenase (short-subunit alcohol dehydrogenase family) [Pseudoxanthomonas sp. SORGH_AS_0997]